MIQQYRTKMIATDSNKEQIFIDLNHWSFLGMGEGHIILKNDDIHDPLYWKVIMVCIHEVHTSPQEFQTLYFQLLESIPNIKNHLLSRMLINISQVNREDLKIFLSQQLKISKKPAHNFMIFLADNLNRSKDSWQYSLQFKPKTPLPDKYSKQFFTNFAQKLGIKTETLQQIMNNRPLDEKTRWFKKNALKTKKSNMNPLQIFSIPSSKSPNLAEKLKLLENFEGRLPFNSNQAEILNANIIKEIEKSKILSAILFLELLYFEPSDLSSTQFLSQWSKEEDKQKKLTHIRQNLKKSISQSNQQNLFTKIINLLESNIVYSHEKLDCSQVEKMFRFLVSWSWRDVSLFIRLKIDHQTFKIKATDFTIIDYEIKESSKLAETILNDQKFLKNYLKYLNLI